MFFFICILVWVSTSALCQGVAIYQVLVATLHLERLMWCEVDTLQGFKDLTLHSQSDTAILDLRGNMVYDITQSVNARQYDLFHYETIVDTQPTMNSLVPIACCCLLGE